MDGMPEMSPAIGTIFGDQQLKETVKKRLLELAAAADDPAYAQRLREAADGRRPLRSLLSDPSWVAAFSPSLEEVDKAESQELGEDERKRLAEEFAKQRQSISLTDLASHARATADLSERTKATVAADTLTGWQGSVDFLEAKRSSESEAKGRANKS